MWLPEMLRVLVDPLVVNSAPTALEQQVAQRQMHTHASNGRVERMAIARHQPLTAWPTGHFQNRPVEAACTNATAPQILAAMRNPGAGELPRTLRPTVGTG